MTETEAAATALKPGAWLTGRSTYRRELTQVAVPTTDPRVVRSIDLISREAELLDHKDYLAWQELYAEDGIYVVPIDRETEEFDNHLNLIFDDDRLRRLRVVRLTEGYAISAVDAATTIRTLGRFVPAAVDDTEVRLRAAQTVVAYKRQRYDLWAGEVEYVIRLGREASDDRLVLKVIRLIDSDCETPAAGFLL